MLSDLAISGSVDFKHRWQLPMSGGVYLVYSDEMVIYVGQTQNFAWRWRNHHRRFEIRKYPNVTIRYIEMGADEAVRIEKQLIEELSPIINRSTNSDDPTLRLLVAQGQRDDMRRLAALLAPSVDNVMDKHGNANLSGLVRHLVYDKLAELEPITADTNALKVGDLVRIHDDMEPIGHLYTARFRAFRDSGMCGRIIKIEDERIDPHPMLVDFAENRLNPETMYFGRNELKRIA